MYRALLIDWKNGEYIKKNSVGWIWTLICVVSYIPFVILGIDELRGTVCYYTYGIPMLVGIFLTRACPNRINKTLLLCPLTFAERKHYVYTGFAIRIVISLIIFLVLNIPMYILGDLNKIYFWIESAYYLFYVIGLNVYVPPIVSARNSYEKKYNLPKYYNFWEACNHFWGIFGGAVMVDQFRLEKHELLSFGVLGICILGGIEIICVIVLVSKYFRPVMEQAMLYESCIQEEGKA